MSKKYITYLEEEGRKRRRWLSYSKSMFSLDNLDEYLERILVKSELSVIDNLIKIYDNEDN
jgi:hypothetical protein